MLSDPEVVKTVRVMIYWHSDDENRVRDSIFPKVESSGITDSDDDSDADASSDDDEALSNTASPHPPFEYLVEIFDDKESEEAWALLPEQDRIHRVRRCLIDPKIKRVHQSREQSPHDHVSLLFSGLGWPHGWGFTSSGPTRSSAQSPVQRCPVSWLILHVGRQNVRLQSTCVASAKSTCLAQDADAPEFFPRFVRDLSVLPSNSGARCERR